MNEDYDKPATISAAMIGIAESENGDIAPHIKPATTYQKGKGYSYYRDDGPGLSDSEEVLKRLECGADALLFSSGMAAATHLLIGLGPDSHILAPETMYWFLRSWMLKQAPAFGLTVTLYPNGDTEAVRKAIIPGKTKAVWAETPANPDWSITDIAAVAEIAHAANAKLLIDSTAATPILTRPLLLGADVVMHSATKYLNGHSDVLAGALVTREKDDLWQRTSEARTGFGSTLGAMESWMLLRGMRPLDVRMQRHSENALKLSEALSRHPAVSHVLYPGLDDHPGHAIAAKQMQGGFGGMMSIRLAGGPAAAARMVTRTKLFRNATSLGGTESLIEHRGPVEGPDSLTPQDLLRLSVGLEDADDLLADIEQALGQ
ncbi:MAG: PLP-dependent aspartate aminotransferase family protein [Rhodospirillales bacterium]